MTAIIRNFGSFDGLDLTDSEKEILWLGEIAFMTAAYGKNIGPLNVEYVVNDKGQWAYRMHTRKKTGYETSPGLIESKFKFSYNGAAESAAKKMADLYWIACNEND